MMFNQINVIVQTLLFRSGTGFIFKCIKSIRQKTYSFKNIETVYVSKSSSMVYMIVLILIHKLF